MDIPRRTLEVNFRKATGQTLAHELANARIQRARELLSTTDLSIKEIAFLVGFSEPRMLTLVFKRMTKEKPSEYRARVRPGE
jgi:transcriptional regulator GlxA family with amidase domain